MRGVEPAGGGLECEQPFTQKRVSRMSRKAGGGIMMDGASAWGPPPPEILTDLDAQHDSHE